MYKFKRLFAFAMIVALLATFALPAAPVTHRYSR
jgi:hypothetical protein